MGSPSAAFTPAEAECPAVRPHTGAGVFKRESLGSIAGSELSSLGMISPVVLSQRSGSFVLNRRYDRNNYPAPLIDTKSRRGLSVDLEMAEVYF